MDGGALSSAPAARPASGRGGGARLFFALWPDTAARGALAQLATGLRRECGGHAVRARNLHLTLVFLGNAEDGRLPQIRALAAGVAAPPFALTIDSVGYWPHNRIVWAGPRDCPAAVRGLVAALETRLREAGFSFDDRPYAPHVTLLRGARSAPDSAAAGDIAWRARDFALVQSVRREAGSVYEVVDRWPLKPVNQASRSPGN